MPCTVVFPDKVSALVKILIQRTPCELIQSGCYFTDELHSIQVTKKKKKKHLPVFDVNNHYPQGMDVQGNKQGRIFIGKNDTL